MALRIKAPVNSFVQWNEVDVIDSCNFDSFSLCLPVFQDKDVYFQFIVEGDTAEETDALCDLENSLMAIGIAANCGEDRLLTFEEKPNRFRISDKQVLYNWQHGFPNFRTVISNGQCFLIKITIQTVYTIYDFCSNCFQRISNPCHTSVIEYGNDDNAFGFDYCGGGAVESNDVDCEPLIVEFTNKENIEIPYTTQLQNKYGPVPSVQTWIYDDSGDLVDMGIRESFDMFPPTKIKIDFGGFSSGIIKIS